MKTKAFALALALTFIGVTASAYAADVTAPVAPAKPAARPTTFKPNWGEGILFAAISANPYLAFWMQAERSGELSFVWRGDNGFEHREVRRLTVA